MIFKIEKPNPNILHALRYNEKKANGEEGPRPEDKEALELIENGHILVTRNVPDERSISDEFDRLKMLTLKTRRSGPPLVNSTFHMSVNPSATDRKLDEEKTIELIDRVMEGLGYAKQPYRIYKHTDIPRQHYHVVSIRNGQDGRKINDSFERLKLRTLLRDLGKEYGFEIILNDYEKNLEIRKNNTDEGIKVAPKPETKKEETKKKSEKKEDKPKTFVPPYSRNDETPVREQVIRAMDEALTWNFTTFEQLQLLLRKRFNVVMEVSASEDKDNLVFAGAKKDGMPDTVFFKDEETDRNYIEKIREKIEKEKMSRRRSQRERLEGLTKAAVNASKTYDEFLTLMERKGVYVVLSWREDGGGAFGVTYLDRATKCAWKGSETSVDLAWLKEVAEENGWTLKPDAVKTKMDKRNRMPNRKANLSTVHQPEAAPTQKKKGFKNPIATAGKFEGSNADITRNHDDILDEKNKKDKPKEYIGE